MYKLLLHIGLPKTATSSLQRNVLMPLHEQRRINFLGRVTHGPKRSDPVFDPFADVFDRIKARPLPPEELRRLRGALEDRLDRDRTNVISNEKISSVQSLSLGSGPANDLSDVSATLHNLGGLFRDDDVTLMVSLRNPVDYVFSWYVEIYWWQFYERREEATLDWFFEQLLCHGPEDEPWFAFFPEAVLRALARYFARIHVVLYEDLDHDRPAYFATIAAGLPAEPEEIARLFLGVRQNPGVYTESGKRGRHLTVRHIVRQRFPHLFRGYTTVRPWLQRVPFLLPLCHRVADVATPVAVEHPYPAEGTRRRLQEKLGLQDDYLTRVHGLSEEKLAGYGYLHPLYGVARPIQASAFGTPPKESYGGRG